MHLSEISEINYARCKEWHEDPTEWSPNDWAVAMGGEVGEIGLAIEDFLLALMGDANRAMARGSHTLDLCKKLRRMTSDIESNNNPPTVEIAIQNIGKEIADTVLYADLLCHRLGLKLERLLIDKFNFISERENLPQRMEPDMERAKFEVWAINNIASPQFSGHPSTGGVWAYHHNFVNMTWSCWQAARRR